MKGTVEWMRVFERPTRIEEGGRGFRVFDPDTETVDVSASTRVRHTLQFALAGDTAQRMLLAVAAFADESGIASGWDEQTATAKGVSTRELAKRAGVDQARACLALDELCRANKLLRLQTKTQPPGLVWVLPDFEDDL